MLERTDATLIIRYNTDNEYFEGFTANFPISAGTGDHFYCTLFRDLLLPIVRQFDPQLILVSAGFDGHRLDPMAETNLETEDYLWVTQLLTGLAKEYANDRLISTLEGGYHLNALAESVGVHVGELVRAGR